MVALVIISRSSSDSRCIIVDMRRETEFEVTASARSHRLATAEPIQSTDIKSTRAIHGGGLRSKPATLSSKLSFRP